MHGEPLHGVSHLPSSEVAAVTGDFLEQMAGASRARADHARAQLPFAELVAHARSLPPAPALRLSGFDIIAELKRVSPAAGPLAAADFSATDQLEAYARGGAAAVSVLTEPSRFDGSLEHLREAADYLRKDDVPVMRKDFLVDPYQIAEARAAGASGVLLIVAMQSDDELTEMLTVADELDLFVLLEAFDVDQLSRANRLADQASFRGELLVGVNCRNLRTLAVDSHRFADLAPHLGSTRCNVAESGLKDANDVEAVVRLGYGAVLMGTALMGDSAPAETLARLLAAGRRLHQPRSGSCS